MNCFSPLAMLALSAATLQISVAAPSEAVLAKTSETPITIKVMALNFDPIIPNEGGKRLHEVCKWGAPHELADAYIADIKKASRGYVNYKIVTWKDIDTFHTKIDGFTYTPEQYMECRRTGKGWHKPDTADYVKTFKDYKIIPLIDKGEVDEVWFFGAPYFGYNESAMAGPGAFFINGDVYDKAKSKRAFAIMGFNYEREVGCMLEDFCHRTEGTMSHYYKSKDAFYPALPATNNWEKFRMIDKVDPGNSGCGFCHYAPNSTGDYEWGNNTKVYSTCDDWLKNWPNLKGAETKRLVDSSEWGGGDCRLHHIWWLTHIPNAPGVNADGKQNNWWKYMCDFNTYDASGKPKTGK